MSNVLILGANGQIAKLAEKQLLAETPHHLTLFLRNASRISASNASRETIVDGSADNADQLKKAALGQDIVYANLAGNNIEDQAKAVVTALDTVGIKRLIWISTLGIYDEVPGKFGEWNNATLQGYLQRYAAAAKVLEDSDLDYTLIRPAWLTNNDVIDYETTQKGDAFKGTEVSRKSIADFVVKLINDPSQEVRHSVGINQPNTDGDKPAFY